jgi:hypothetical protein
MCFANPANPAAFSRSLPGSRSGGRQVFVAGVACSQLFRQALSHCRSPQLIENTAKIARANFADYFLEITTLVLGAANAEKRSGKPKLRVFGELRRLTSSPLSFSPPRSPSPVHAPRFTIHDPRFTPPGSICQAGARSVPVPALTPPPHASGTPSPYRSAPHPPCRFVKL